MDTAILRHHYHQLQHQSTDEEKKCLLTPTSLNSVCGGFAQNETDVQTNANETSKSKEELQASESTTTPTVEPDQQNSNLAAKAEELFRPLFEIDPQQPHHYFFGSPLIYSEPALNSAASLLRSEEAQAAALARFSAYSDSALPRFYPEDPFADDFIPSSNDHDNGSHHVHHNHNINPRGSIASRLSTATEAGRPRAGKMLSRGFTPKSSCLFHTESQPSIGTGSAFIPHKQSFSVTEIREQHIQIQKKYRPSRKRHFTDPVDFEGILNIIGGCSWWQIWVYLLISLQQIPHAMFNLSVVYMMYQPDHWCQIPGLNNTNKNFTWRIDQTLDTSIIFPRTRNKQRDDPNFHSQCHYFDRGIRRFEDLGRMSIEDAIKSVEADTDENANVSIVKCQKWYYDSDVMKNTIVTEWNLVCDDNFKRAHAHLFYSFGFLLGCLLGGYSSDRFGRKPTVIGFGILSSMFGLILPYSTYFPMFLFIRFCGAVCNEAADLAAYVLCMEITGTRYRAMVGSLLQAPWAVGYATLALIAYFCKSWQLIQLITAALHTLTICLICVLPESPRWLIVNNRVDEAERYIRRACREPPFPFSLCKFNKSSLPCDLELVKHAEQRKWVRRDQRANLAHLLKSRALCMRTGIICIVWIATALVYYGLVIALSDQSAPGRVLFSGNFFVNNAIAGAIELPTLMACVYLMKFGRKKSQMFTLIGAALFIMAAMTAMAKKSPMLALPMMLIGKIFIQGAFNILYIFTSEMYPTVIRNSAVGFCSMIARFGSGVSSYIAILSDVTLAIVPMIIFATFSLFAGTLVLLLPETRDQPLPDTLQDAVTFLKNNDHPYECGGTFPGLGGIVGGKLLASGKYSVSVQGHRCGLIGAGGDGDKASSCCGDAASSCGCGHGGTTIADDDEDDDDQRTLIDGDVDDNISTLSTPVMPMLRKRSETVNPMGDSVLPSIPEVPDREHLQQQNSQDKDKKSSTPSEDEELTMEVEEDSDEEEDDESLEYDGTPILRSRHKAGTSTNSMENDDTIKQRKVSAEDKDAFLLDLAKSDSSLSLATSFLLQNDHHLIPRHPPMMTNRSSS